jgi:hypothetical protein
MDSIASILASPEILLYQWIADLNSGDPQTAVAALKSLSGQLKKDSSIFTPHVDPLMVSLLAAMHSQFRCLPLPVRICKYISFCILTLLTETRLASGLSETLVRQLVTELLQNLSASSTEQIINQVLNAIILKLIEDSPLRSFSAFLASLSDFTDEGISEKRIKLAIKCLEASGLRLCEVGQADAIHSASFVTAEFFGKHKPSVLQQSQRGEKILAALNGFTALVESSKTRPETNAAQGLRLQGKPSARKIISPEVPKKVSPLQNLRQPR